MSLIHQLKAASSEFMVIMFSVFQYGRLRARSPLCIWPSATSAFISGAREAARLHERSSLVSEGRPFCARYAFAMVNSLSAFNPPGFVFDTGVAGAGVGIAVGSAFGVGIRVGAGDGVTDGDGAIVVSGEGEGSPVIGETNMVGVGMTSVNCFSWMGETTRASIFWGDWVIEGERVTLGAVRKAIFIYPVGTLSGRSKRD